MGIKETITVINQMERVTGWTRLGEHFAGKLASMIHARYDGPMKRRDPPVYPDNSDILARKVAGRRDLAGRPFGEKIAAMEQLRERLAPLKRAREQRLAKPKPR